MNTIIEYIWIDANNHFRSKTRLITNSLIINLSSVPNWNYNGSSTGQTDSDNSEVTLIPVFLCPDPFRLQNHKLVYCITYHDGKALENNYYNKAINIFDTVSVGFYKPWFGMEQEFFIMDKISKMPVEYSKNNKQGKYYCNIDECPKVERKIMEEFLSKAIDANLNICGINAEAAQGQWEFQIGPCLGIEIGNHMMIARYILCRVAHEHHCTIDFSPKPLGNDWNGSGCHINYSTFHTRSGNQDKNQTGLDVIHDYIKSLEKVHHEMIQCYGKDNELRMTGHHETASISDFSHSVGGTTTSIRIGKNVEKNKYGYFEDRRPAANCDPYLVSCLLFYHTCIKQD